MSNKQFISNLSATYADVRKLDVKKINLKGKNILEYIKESIPTIKHSQDTRETVTEDDLWGQYIETKSDGTIIVHDDWVTNPKASKRMAWDISITKVENNKAYIDDELYGNIQTERINNGNYMFYSCKVLTSFHSNLPNLTNGTNMFRKCSRLTTFDADLSSLTRSNCMFTGCYNLTSFNCDLSSLQNGSSMFNECTSLKDFNSNLPNLWNGGGMFYNTDIAEWNTDLPSLTDGGSMFHFEGLQTNADVAKGLITFNAKMPNLTYGYHMFYYCHNLTSFSSDLSSLTMGNEMFYDCRKLTSFSSALPSLTNGLRMFHYCKLDATSVTNIIHFIPQRDAKPTDSWAAGNITIGIGITNTDAAKQAFAEECDCDSWDELNKELDDKNWAVEWQFNGEATTFDLRSPRPSTAVYAKLEEVIMPTDKKAYKPHYQYTSQDGSKFYNIHWYHDSNTNNEGVDYFESLEEAISAYGVIPKA